MAVRAVDDARFGQCDAALGVEVRNYEFVALRRRGGILSGGDRTEREEKRESFHRGG